MQYLCCIETNTQQLDAHIQPERRSCWLAAYCERIRRRILTLWKMNLKLFSVPWPGICSTREEDWSMPFAKSFSHETGGSNEFSIEPYMSCTNAFRARVYNCPSSIVGSHSMALMPLTNDGIVDLSEHVWLQSQMQIPKAYYSIP